MKRIMFRKVPLDIFTPDELADIVENLLSNGKNNIIVLLNYENYLKAKVSQRFRSQLSEAALIIPISSLLTRGVQFLNKDVECPHYDSFSVLIHILGILENKRRSAYFLSSSVKKLLKAGKNLQDSFPQLSIVGRHPGYIPSKRKADIITAIKKSAPNLLFAGRGINAEEWLYSHQKEFANCISVYDKDFMDIVAGGKRYRKTPLVYLIHPWRLVLLFTTLWYWFSLSFIKLFKLHRPKERGE